MFEPKPPGAHRPEGRPPKPFPRQQPRRPDAHGRQRIAQQVPPSLVTELVEGLRDAMGNNFYPSPRDMFEIRRGTNPAHLITKYSVLEKTGQKELTPKQWEAIKAGEDPLDIINEYHKTHPQSAVRPGADGATMPLPTIPDPRRNSRNR